MSASLEAALKAIITGLPAFASLSPTPKVRPYKIPIAEFKAETGSKAVITESADEEHAVDLDARGGVVSAKAAVIAVAEEFDDAWDLAEIIRLGGASPGTGLAGYHGPIAGLFIQRISVNATKKGHVAYEDGGDEGYYFVRRELTVDYSEAI